MKQFYNSVVLHVTQLLQRLGDSACVHAGVCTCTCGSCLYGLLMAVEFFNLQSHTSENYCACLSLKLMKGAFQPLWSRRMEATEDVTWVVTELGQQQLSMTRIPMACGG